MGEKNRQMSRYIDAEPLQKDGWKLHREKRKLTSVSIEGMELYAVPTADVVEVVRCKDCLYYTDGECKAALPFSEYSDCTEVWVTPKPNDYCSYGERR